MSTTLEEVFGTCDECGREGECIHIQHGDVFDATVCTICSTKNYFLDPSVPADSPMRAKFLAVPLDERMKFIVAMLEYLQKALRAALEEEP